MVPENRELLKIDEPKPQRILEWFGHIRYLQRQIWKLTNPNRTTCGFTISYLSSLCSCFSSNSQLLWTPRFPFLDPNRILEGCDGSFRWRIRILWLWFWIIGSGTWESLRCQPLQQFYTKITIIGWFFLANNTQICFPIWKKNW